MKLHTLYIVLWILILVSLASCSTTRNLSEGQQLYIGQKSMEIINPSKSKTEREALTEIEAALAKAPNNAFLGSSSLRTPFPFGLWIYNAYVNKSQNGLNKWIFKKFATKPIYISEVNPELRAKVATNLLHDYGFFNGVVRYEVITKRNNPRKAHVRYYVDMKKAYMLDTVMYKRFQPEVEGLFLRSGQRTLLHKGDQFNVVKLDAERKRLSTFLRNRGYYYFSSEYLGFRADTTRVSGLVDLQIIPKAGLPVEAMRPFYIGDLSVYLYGAHGETLSDSIKYKDMMIYYHKKLNVRPEVLLKRFRFQTGQLYSEMRSSRTQERFSDLGIFRYAEMQFIPRDTTNTSNVLDVAMKTVYDLPYDSELSLNMATKSNDYMGPGLVYGITKRNVFKGGETFSVQVKGSYEWETKSSGDSNFKINSYELGATASLTFPRLFFPRLGKNGYDFPASTKFSLNVDQLNRARYFKMLSFGGEIVYQFQPTRVSKHTISPLRLTFNTLLSQTEKFDSIVNARPALRKSMQSQFIPALVYTYTYDDALVRRRGNRFWWQTSFTSSGNLISGVSALVSKKKFTDETKLFGAKMAQFLKLTSEIRYTWVIDKNQSIASRVTGGIIYAYGANKISPYSEQFYVGGANSIRAFAVRTVGPGRYNPTVDKKYDYLDQVGDLKFEANLEYRFRIVKDLYGAVFLDTGNIWLLRDDPSDGKVKRVGGKFALRNFGKDLALGTGAGLRYDFSYLIIRLDCGVGLHLPYTTSRSGYYNIPNFKDGLGIHLAVGYPF